jgi:hypothetical protein
MLAKGAGVRICESGLKSCGEGLHSDTRVVPRELRLCGLLHAMRLSAARPLRLCGKPDEKSAWIKKPTGEARLHALGRTGLDLSSLLH